MFTSWRISIPELSVTTTVSLKSLHVSTGFHKMAPELFICKLPGAVSNEYVTGIPSMFTVVTFRLYASSNITVSVKLKTTG